MLLNLYFQFGRIKIVLEEINIVKFDEQDILNKYFFDKTSLNFEYNNRKAFKSNGEYNEKFNKEIINNIKFSGYYISCCEEKIHTEFDVGFCDVRSVFENDILKSLKNEFKFIYVIIRVSNPRNEFRITNEIEKKYEIADLIKSTQNVYIIKYNKDIEVKYMDYIDGYIFGFKEIQIKLNGKFNIALDLENVKELLSKTSIILFRVPVFSNHNLLIYKS